MRRCLQSLDALQLSPVEPNVPASATADGLRVGSLPIHNSSVPRSQQLQEALTRQAAVSCGEFQAQVASLSVCSLCIARAHTRTRWSFGIRAESIGCQEIVSTLASCVELGIHPDLIRSLLIPLRMRARSVRYSS